MNHFDQPSPSEEFQPCIPWEEVFEHIPMPAAILSRDFRFLAVNQAFERFFGYAGAHVAGRDSAFTTLDEDREQIQARRARMLAMAAGEHVIDDIRVRCADGSVRMQRLRSSLISAGEADPLFLSIAENISEARATQQALLDSVQWYKLLFDQSPVPKVLYSATNRIIEVNPAACRYSGYDASDLIGRDPADILDEPSARSVRHNRDRHDWDAVADPPPKGRTLVRKDGSRRSFHALVRRMIDRSGEKVFVLTLIDQTDEIERRRQLEHAAMLQRAVMDATTAGVILYWEGRVQSINNSFDHRFGKEAATALVFLFERQQRAGAAQTNDPSDHSIQNAPSRSQREEIELVALDGSIRTCDVVAQPVIQSETRFGMVITVHDITDLRDLETERIRAIVAQRDGLVREVHHHIKNNLQGIVGLLHLDAARSPAAAETLVRAAVRVQAIAHIFGLQSQHRRLFGIAELLVGITDNLSTAYSMQIHCELVSMEALAEWQLPEQEAVPMALVLNELLTNAIRHRSTDGEVSVTAEARDAGILVAVTNPGRLPDRLANCWKQDSIASAGLGLVKAMLPRRGASIRFVLSASSVRVELVLSQPAVQRRDVSDP